MSTSPLSGVDTEAVERFARRLKERPELALKPSGELAREFGLDVEFVRMVLQGVGPFERKPARDPLLAAVDTVRRALARVDQAWSVLTASPHVFVAVTTFLAIAVWLPGIAIDRIGRGYGIVAAIVSFGAVVLQLAAYYRHGMVRWALYGGLAGWLVAASVLMIQHWARNQDSPTLILQMFVIGIVAFVFAVLHTVVGSVAAVLGGYAQLRREETREQNMTRQQLLERLFEIQSRLKDASDLPDRPAGIAGWPPVQVFQRHPYAYSLALGVALSVVAVGLLALATGGRLDRDAIDAPFPLGVSIAFNIVSILLVAAIGFFAGGVRRGLVANGLSFVGSLAPTWVMQAFGVSLAEEFTSLGTMIVIAMIYAFISVFGSIGARVEERAARERRLGGSDKRTLLAEKVRIEWLLSPNSARAVCVMVVDAAKSSLMKAQEPDPYVVEWTFREYQKFIELVAGRQGGTVHSTAGDGAVVAFHQARDAFAAARQLQTDVIEFNRSVNRLKLPFRLRIGLHQGEVIDDLAKVEYTAVIDIAAHIEGVAPVGGIALTDAVARDLNGEPLAELKDTIDGFQVYVALNPTLGGS